MCSWVRRWGPAVLLLTGGPRIRTTRFFLKIALLTYPLSAHRLGVQNQVHFSQFRTPEMYLRLMMHTLQAAQGLAGAAGDSFHEIGGNR